MIVLRWTLLSLLVAVFSTGAAASETIRLAADPALSPDGETLALVWRGDIWLAPVEGGSARRLTQHEATDRRPLFSPDGTEIAFISDRDAGDQVYVVDVEGGRPTQLTFHTAGYRLEDWDPTGQTLLASGRRDYFWRSSGRFLRIARDQRQAEQLLFDADGSDGRLSSDGQRLLFTREGMTWWRKGYRGSRASQVWMYDLTTRQYTKLLAPETGARWPLWDAEGAGFYYVGAESGSFNLWKFDLETKEKHQLTSFQDDSVVLPCISRDGSTIVFRHLFDLYRYRPGSDAAAVRIDLIDPGDAVDSALERKLVTEATDVAFSDDGLEVAYIAGGDLWVMDTELREPRQITATAEQERGPVFGPEGHAIYFTSDEGGQCDIWRAQRGDAEKYWWQNEAFERKQLTHDAEVEADLRLSPDGTRISFIKGLGDLWTMTLEGKEARRVLRSWNQPDYDWAPDGTWIVYAVDDNNFNRDIWIVPADGSADAVNISRHPYDEYNPVWRPDGKLIAFVGQRLDREADIFYVWLDEREYEKDQRDRTLEKAVKKMEEGRKDDGEKDKNDQKKGDDPNAPDEEGRREGEKKDDELPKVVIDFDRIHERVRRIEIADGSPSNLFWSPDSKKLAFTGAIKGARGTYTVEIPDELEPTRLTKKTGSQARWLKEGNQIVWLSDDKPARLSATGEETAYPFTARQAVDREAHFRAGFDLAWRLMRDHFYDERLGNRNWDAVRRKYADVAATAPDVASLGTVINLMLGELNGSHLGFYPRGAASGSGEHWRISTAHLGVRFDSDYRGPGLKVRDVLPNGPADRKTSKIEPNEIIVSIDGVNVDPQIDLTEVLNGPLDRDIHLDVHGAEGERRTVVLRPISYGQAWDLLYEHWLRHNRQMVEDLSDGRLGYIHIRGMNWPSFQKLEQELYAVGAGKDGLVIDVRNNGGGFTADHVLTLLCQPAHAITVPRGGGRGYPEDRRVYATWSKPIVMLCNQNSFSNAEIISHAVKTLRRGKLVGTPTAGGVISTGGTSIMDLGFLRLPFRGWYVLPTGEDMELNGTVPDVILWPEPGQMPQGKDIQLEKAVDVLRDDVDEWKAQPQPALRKASERQAL